MPFGKEDKALTTNLHKFKKYGSQRIVIEFLKDKLQKGRTGHLSENIRETRSTDHRRKTGRSKYVRTEKKVTTVNELIGLLNQEDQKQTHRSTRQISRETGLTQRSIVQSFTPYLGFYCGNRHFIFFETQCSNCSVIRIIFV